MLGIAVPPNVWAQAGPDGVMPQPQPQTAPPPQRQVQPRPQTLPPRQLSLRPDPRVNRPSRIAFEALGGTVGMVAGVGLGFFAACPNFDCPDLGNFFVGILFASVGLVVGLPTGVWIAGDATGMDGSWGWTLVGMVAGGAIGGAVASSMSGNSTGESAAGVFSLVSLLGGAIAGYELTLPEPMRFGAQLQLRPAPGGLGLALTW